MDMESDAGGTMQEEGDEGGEGGEIEIDDSPDVEVASDDPPQQIETAPAVPDADLQLANESFFDLFDFE